MNLEETVALGKRQKPNGEILSKAKQMSGIQLWAGKDQSFQQEYQITGIPRFILIDPQGNIVDANAKRPSDPELKTLFNSLKI